MLGDLIPFAVGALVGFVACFFVIKRNPKLAAEADKATGK